MIISDDFLSQLHNSRPDFQSRNPVIGRRSSRDFLTENATWILGFGIAISTYISIKKTQFHVPTLRLLLLTPTLHATQFQLLNVSGWSINNAQLLTTTPVYRPLFQDSLRSRYQKGKTSLDLNEARDNDGVWGHSGISWTICKQYAPRSIQITTPTPHHSIFTGRMLFVMPNQHFQSTEGKNAPKEGIYVK